MAKVKEKAPKFPPRNEVTGSSITRPLTNQDRCDRCGPAVQAHVRMRLAFSTLDFCAHCYVKNEPALIGQGFVIDQDNRKDVG